MKSLEKDVNVDKIRCIPIGVRRKVKVPKSTRPSVNVNRPVHLQATRMERQLLALVKRICIVNL